VLLESAMSMGDDGFSARLALGVAYLGVDDPQRAWKVLASLARRHADDELVVHQLYRAGLATGCWSELADLLARYVTFRPDDYEKRYAFASVCVRAGRLEEARAHYHHLRSIMPTMIGLDHLRRRLESQAPATMPIALRA
jgi:thioredoxin-like negative regulator of GroEL